MSTAGSASAVILSVLLALSSHLAVEKHPQSVFSSRILALGRSGTSQQQTKRPPAEVTVGQSSTNWLHPSDGEYRKAIRDGFKLQDISQVVPTVRFEDIQPDADVTISIRSPLNCAKELGFTYAQLRGEPLLADVQRICGGSVSIDVTHFSMSLGKNWSIVLKHGASVLQPDWRRLDRIPSAQTYQNRLGYSYFDQFTFKFPETWTDDVTVIWTDDDGVQRSKRLDLSLLAVEDSRKLQSSSPEIQEKPAVPAITAKYDAFKDETALTLRMNVSPDADMVLMQSCKGDVQNCVLPGPEYLRNPALFILGRTDDIPDETTIYPLLILVDGERMNLGNMGCKFDQFVGGRVGWRCYMTPYVSDFLRVVHGRIVRAQIAHWEFQLTEEQLGAMRDFGRKLGYE